MSFKKDGNQVACSVYDKTCAKYHNNELYSSERIDNDDSTQ